VTVAPDVTTDAVIDLGPLAGDTIPDRRWRIVVEHGGHVLQCDALVPGGWQAFAAWLGLTIAPVAVSAQLELIAA
jgi:hypothetical protein